MRLFPVNPRVLLPFALLCSHCSAPQGSNNGGTEPNPSETASNPTTPPTGPTATTPGSAEPPVNPTTPAPTNQQPPPASTSPSSTTGATSSAPGDSSAAPDDTATSDAPGVDSSGGEPASTEVPDATTEPEEPTGPVITPIEQPSDTCAPRAGYRNLFKEYLRKTDDEVVAKVNAAFQHLFHGGNDAKVYYEANGDEAYILDVNNNDVRSEGMSYGMAIAVQLDKKAEFDKIWKWARSHMYVTSGQYAGYFNWQMSRDAGFIDGPAAPDGEEYFAHALILASRRWGDGQGIFNYGNEARNLLDALINKGAFSRGDYLVKFHPTVNYSDPSYVLPAFYEVWACFDSANQQFWKQAATVGRTHLQRATDRPNGLAPYLSNYDGSPHQNGSYFDTDAWRVVGNIMMDYNLYKRDQWYVDFAKRFADFFDSQRDKRPLPAQFTLDGNVRVKPDGMREEYNEPAKGLWAQNAFVAYAVEPDQGLPYVQALWDSPLPTGQYRYYDGMLYMFAMLHLSGNFRSEW